MSEAALAKLRELIDRPDVGTESRYEILERIGEGGMGAVYLAYDRELAREVALKVLRTPEPDASERARILREARILASLEHPGIVPVHDAGVLPDGRVFYVMKRVRGERLDDYARSGRPRSELLRVFRQVCEAVAFAHAGGVVHRDLKPQNVMLGAFGEVLVLDWGAATVRGETAPTGERDASSESSSHTADSVDTAPGTVIGTPGYMAPEQLSGAAKVDQRTDVYGLGGILHFLLSGAHPSATQAGDVGEDLPGALRAIRDRARAAEPANRYRSASELAADISNYLDALPVTAHRERVVERVRRVAARHRTALLLVLAYLLMRLALLIFA